MAEEKTFTQEEVNAFVVDRLNRQKEQIEEGFKGWLSPEEVEKRTADNVGKIETLSETIKEMTGKASNHEKEVAELNSRIAAYEKEAVKSKVAREHGIPYELIGSLSGETEEDLKKSAETLAKYLKPSNPAPMRNPESGATDSFTEAFRKLNPKLNF